MPENSSNCRIAGPIAVASYPDLLHRRDAFDLTGITLGGGVLRQAQAVLLRVRRCAHERRSERPGRAGLGVRSGRDRVQRGRGQRDRVQMTLEAEAMVAGSTVAPPADAKAGIEGTDVAVQATGGTALAVTDFADIGTVTVTIPAGDPEGTQTFSFSPVDDSIDEGLSETVILGGTVQGLSVRTATLTIADNDGKGIELSQGPVTLREEDRDGSYTVALATQPTGTVTVRVSVSGNPDVKADPDSLAFTASDWDQSQTVTVRAAHDDDAAPDTAQLNHSASGADYGGVRALALAVEIEDNDERGVTVSQTTALEFREGGRASYTVMLDTQPTGTVTVTPTVTATSTGTRTVTADPSPLTFTANNWDRAQTVTLSTNNDDMVRDDATATVAHSAIGGDYGSVTIASVEVTVPGLVIVGMKVTIRIPMDGIVLVPEGTPVPSGIRLVLPVGLAGQRVSLSPGALPANTPRGFRAGNALVDIELEPRATLSGEATVCLPSQGRGRVFRWDDAVEPPVWVELVAPPAGSPLGLACGTTEQFALFALGSAQQDRIAKAWLARFGRTAAQHVTDAVQDRLGAPRAAGFSGTLAGQPLPAPGTVSPGVADTGSPVQRLDVELTGTGDGPGARSVVLTPRDLLTGSRFSLTTESEDGASFAVWGRGAVTGFDSRDGEASVEGHVSTGLVGADVASGPLVAGLALSLSEGRGTWTLDGEQEDVKSSMTGLHPFVGYELSKRLSVWGVAGLSLPHS